MMIDNKLNNRSLLQEIKCNIVTELLIFTYNGALVQIFIFMFNPMSSNESYMAVVMQYTIYTFNILIKKCLYNSD